MHPVHPRNLRAALDELAEREQAGEPNYPICCLLLLAGPPGEVVDKLVARYVWDHWGELDDWTDSDSLIFVPTPTFQSRV